MLFLRLSLLLISICGTSLLAGKVKAGAVSSQATKLTGRYLWVSALPMAQGTTTEPPAAWEELRDVLTNDSKPFSPRSRALYLACTSAGEESAHEILGIIGAWLSELETAGTETIHANKTLLDKRGLIQEFLNTCVAPVEQVLKDQQSLLRLLQRFVVCNILPGSGLRPFRAIARNPAPVEVRRDFLLSIIAQRRPLSFEDALSPLFDPSTFPRLRELVRTPQESGELNHIAVRILAHYGDREILPELRTWHTRLLEQSPKRAYRAEVAIWKIELQDPPSKLLEYVASPGGWIARDWAVGRAVELGLPKPEIREAILAYARRIVEKGGAVPVETSTLKRAGLELGILQPDDLPDVRIRRGRKP